MKELRLKAFDINHGLNIIMEQIDKYYMEVEE